MSRLQRWILRVMPRKWAEAAEADSRQWMLRCPCGGEISVWDAGGLRWTKSTSSPRTRWRCQRCGQVTWHTVVRAGG